MKAFCAVIEDLSCSRKVRDGKIDDAIYEILERAATAIKTQRVNAWLFNEDHSEIHCIGNFDASQHRITSQANLARIAMPKYFHLFETEKIIHTPNAQSNPITAELLEGYLKPYGILSLMDIPIRIEGERIGVICFEDTASERVWTEEEQNFGVVMAQFVSMAVETSERLETRMKLEKALEDQKLLMQEVHHRVKNNLTIVSSLLNLQSEKAKDDYHYKLFQEARDRLNSIAALHQLLYQTQSYNKINFKTYLEEILKNLKTSFSNQASRISFEEQLEPVMMDVGQAIPMALIVNELITNAFKHAFPKGKTGKVSIQLKEDAKHILLRIADNGKGFDPKQVEKSSIGLDILDALILQLNASMTFSSIIGSTYEISLNKV